MTKVTAKIIGAAISKFTTNRDSLQAQAHTIALMIFNHAAPKEVGPDCNGTGDCTSLITLLDAMPSSWAGLMKKWFELNTPIRVNGKKTGYELKYKKLKDDAEKLKWWKLEDANTTPYYELETGGGNGLKVLKFDDLLKMATSLAARIDGYVEGKNENIEIDVADEAKARILVNMLKTISVDVTSPKAAENDDQMAMRQAANG